MKGTGFKYRVTCEAGGLKKPLNIGYSNKRRAIKAHAKEAVQILRRELPRGVAGAVIIDKWNDLLHKWCLRKLYWV